MQTSLAHAESLKKLDLPATHENAEAMIAALSRLRDAEGDRRTEVAATVRYAEFRRFCVLMPREKLRKKHDPGIAWFEAATCMPLGGAALACAARLVLRLVLQYVCVAALRASGTVSLVRATQRERTLGWVQPQNGCCARSACVSLLCGVHHGAPEPGLRYR